VLLCHGDRRAAVVQRAEAGSDSGGAVAASTFSAGRPRFVGVPGYGISQFRKDLNRFTFLLGGNDSEPLLQPDERYPEPPTNLAAQDGWVSAAEQRQHGLSARGLPAGLQCAKRLSAATITMGCGWTRSRIGHGTGVTDESRPMPRSNRGKHTVTGWSATR
jgi:hypothetical protein